MKLPKAFIKMTRDEQGFYIKKKLEQAQAAYDYWSRQSRQHIYGKVSMIEMERPDLDLMKEDDDPTGPLID